MTDFPEDFTGGNHDIPSERLKEAIDNRDGASYLRFVNRYGLSIDYPELYEQGRLELGIVGCQESEENILDKPPVIRLTDLAKLPIGELENIYNGIHNIGLPAEYHRRSNPAEVIAKYLGAGVLKQGDEHLKNPVRNFEELILTLDSEAFSRRGFAAMAHGAKTPYSTRRNAQKRRLEGLVDEDKEYVMASFMMPAKYSNRQQPQTHDFIDLNIDGSNKKIYARAIQQHIRREIGK